MLASVKGKNACIISGIRQIEREECPASADWYVYAGYLLPIFSCFPGCLRYFLNK